MQCSRSNYDTIRTGLIKKYQTTAQLMADIGDSSMLDSYVQASYDKETMVASFVIAPVSAKKRKPVSYTLL